MAIETPEIFKRLCNAVSTLLVSKKKVMRSHIKFIFFALVFIGCEKDIHTESVVCDIQKAYLDNAAKVTISSGIWGTVTFMEGNCMPIVDPASTTCKTCPVKRTVRIYDYTLHSNATPHNSTLFFGSFNTQLVKEIETDNQGFFQTDLPAGQYTIVVIENGKLYSFGLDGQGGISPLHYTGGKEKINLTLMYKAVF